jgi:hypothetical protein
MERPAGARRRPEMNPEEFMPTYMLHGLLDSIAKHVLRVEAVQFGLVQSDQAKLHVSIVDLKLLMLEAYDAGRCTR